MQILPLYFFQVSKLLVGPFDPGLKCFPVPGAKPCATCVLEGFETACCCLVRPRPEMLPCSFSALPGANPLLFFLGLKCFLQLPRFARCRSFQILYPLFLRSFETACWPICSKPEMLPCSFSALPGANPSPLFLPGFETACWPV